MAELDQNFSEVEHAHESEYQHEDEHAHESEYQHEDEHAHESEYQHEDEHEHEFVPVLELHQNENEEHKNESIEGIPENLESDEKQDDEYVSLAGGGAEKWPGWPGESIFRMLVPAQKVGSIIGRKGEYIKKTCEETKARIKILDGPPGTRERAVMISAKEEPEATLPPAVDGLLKVHKRLMDGMENDPSHPAPGLGGKLSTRLLVPAAQAGSLIGKQGTTVKSIQEESNCIVRVLGAEDLPLFALQDDRIVEVVGEPAGIHKAMELIASHLRKFLVDRSIIHVLEMHMQMPNSQMDHMPPAHSWGPPPQAFQQNAPAGPGYGASPNFMPPPRQFDNYYTPSNMSVPSEKQSHQGVSAYGREALVPAHTSTTQTAQSIITQITQQMQIPLAYADAVIGTQGANISYIRRVSGATITIQETRGVPGEMTVEISGTASQVQTAQQMIQNFMADAAGSTQTQYASSADQAFTSYAAHGSVYTSPPSNASVGGQTGGYSSVYGGNYGY